MLTCCTRCQYKNGVACSNPACGCHLADAPPPPPSPEPLDVDVDAIIKQQADTDASRREMAREIVEGQNPRTLDDAKQFAENWIVTAAQYAANEAYLSGERDKLLAELARLRAAAATGGEGLTAEDVAREVLQRPNMTEILNDVRRILDRESYDPTANTPWGRLHRALRHVRGSALAEKARKT